MLNANFKAYNNYITDSLYQWDKDQDLIINGLNLTVAPEIHFANANMDRAIVKQSTLSNNVVTVRIPNSLLQEALTIKAYVGVYEGTTFNVIETIDIPVIAKSRPSDYSLTDSDEEIYSFVRLENEVVNAKKEIANKCDSNLETLMVTVVNAKSDLEREVANTTNNLTNQVANIVAHNNDTDGNTELIDMRTDFNGNVHISAGEAVRTQAKQIKDDVVKTRDYFNYGLVHLDASINTDSTTQNYGKKFMFPEEGCTIIRFNAHPNTVYKITVIGEHDRFRFYGRLEKDDFEVATGGEIGNRLFMDGIIADKSTDATIDSLNSYEINSGEYQSIYVYLNTDSTDNSPTISIEVAESARVRDKDIVDISATKILAGNYRNIFKPWVPGLETDKSDIQAYTYQELIDNVYEPLRAKYPTYISRSVIGRDASDTYDIYQYTFEPDYYEQTCYLQSGVHAREEDAWVALALLLKHICEDWESNEQLSYLRWGVKMIVVPVVNVWGVSQPVESRHDVNVNGVNLNRDTVDKTQAETQIVTAFFDSIADQLSFAIDYHTTVNNTYGDYMLTAWTGEKNEHIAKRTLYMLARKNAPERLNSYLTKYDLELNDLRLPYVGDSENTGTYVWYFKSKGVPGATVEHSDFVWDNAKCTGISITKALECFGNHLIQHSENKLGILI